MTLDQFRGAFQAGSFSSVGITASGGVFLIVAEPRSGGRVGLETTRGEAPRAFRDPGKAIAVLHGLGARKVDVDTGDGSPGETGAGRRQRPDTAERQRRARAAAAYDAGFRTEVEQALAEADREDSEWVSNEDVMAESRRPRAGEQEGTKTTAFPSLTKKARLHGGDERNPRHRPGSCVPQDGGGHSLDMDGPGRTPGALAESVNPATPALSVLAKRKPMLLFRLVGVFLLR